jgi:hypothetical protein
MDTTFPSAATNSSSCSRSSGVMCALTCAVLFGRVIERKTPAESTRRGRRCPQTGGEAAGSNSCGAVFRVKVWPEVVPQNPGATVFVNCRRLDSEDAIRWDVSTLAPVRYNLWGDTYTPCERCKAPDGSYCSIQSFHVPTLYTSC